MRSSVATRLGVISPRTSRKLARRGHELRRAAEEQLSTRHPGLSIFGLGLALMLGVLTFYYAPDAIRYLKIRRM